MNWRRAVPFVVACGLANQLGAQSDTDWLPGALAPAGRWSVLAPDGDIGRGGPALPPSIGLLRGAPARIGLFWSAGNAAALVSEIDSSGRTDFTATRSATGGDFRRPLDPESTGFVDLCAAGWRPVGDRGAAIGRAAIRRTESTGRGNFALGLAPYAGSPLVPTDTTSPGLWRNVAVLEGGLAWRLSDWTVGGAVGLEVTDARAERARIGRIGRMSAPSLALGATRRVYGPVRLGLHARAGMRNELIETIPVNSVEYVLQLEGLFEVEPRDLGLRNPYRRRFERRFRAFGVSAGAELFGATAVAFVERGGEDEAQSTAAQADPPRDRWVTSTRTFGAAAQRPLFGDLLTAKVETRYTRLTGDATRSDLQGRIYRAVDHRLQLLGVLRLQPPGARWSVAGLGFMRRERRNHRDALANLSTAMVTWLGGGTVEAEHAFVGGGRVGLGYGVALYTPSGSIPAGETLGPIFKRLIAPELEWTTTQALAQRSSVTVTMPIAPRTSLWIGGERLQLGVSGNPPANPFRPGGERTTTAISLGVSLH